MRDSMSSRWASLPAASARSSSSMSDDWTVMGGEVRAPFPAEDQQHGPTVVKKRLRIGVNETGGRPGPPSCDATRGGPRRRNSRKTPRKEPSHPVTDSSMVNETSTLFHGGRRLWEPK